MSITAIYPGTFDPITNGHLDILQRSLRLFNHIILGIGPNPKKTALFTLDERIKMAGEAIKDLPNVSVETFDGLLVDFARKKGASVIIRGLRAVSDFEYEFQMALMNRKLDDKIETVFLMPSEEYSYLTSTIIKVVSSLNGDISSLVPKDVHAMLKNKFKDRKDF
ncbi:MAG: pantetheine-phosphate adenylyltransferase [Nitrospirae bacterium]|nr:pantetheine-phosphate adenylyltransferase [Nitrospirota bacterium]